MNDLDPILDKDGRHSANWRTNTSQCVKRCKVSRNITEEIAT